MTKSFSHIAALAVAAVALTTPAAFAQNGRRDGGNRDGNRGEQRTEQRAERRDRNDARPRAESRDQQRADSGQRNESRAQQRPAESQRFEPRAVAPQQRFESRDRAVVRPRAVAPAYVAPYRSYGSRSYVRPFVYSVPYGYRPSGYRPGWNLNLYFGRPYSVYGYPGYGTLPNYGYYGIVPGRAYGAVRIVDAPRDGQVFVDGYYAGVVDDYDGVFQHLNLEAGPHHIEIQADGYPPSEFDVRIEPGQTVTFHAYRN